MRQCYIGSRNSARAITKKEKFKTSIWSCARFGEELALDNVFLYFAGVEISLPVQKCRGFYVNLQAEIYFIKT